MPRYTQKIPALSTRPDTAAMGSATAHRGVRSMRVAIFTSPPPRSTPTMLVHSRERSGIIQNMMVSIMVQMS